MNPPRSPDDSRTSHEPLFSVVIATYNYGHLIERTLRSLDAQTFRDFEVWVIDDGSTDDTDQRVKPYLDRISYEKKPNGGQASAYNVGIDRANGRFVLILDADDELLPDALEKFADAIADQASQEDVCLYYGGYYSISESGSEKLRLPVPSPSGPRQRLKAFLERRITGLQHGSAVTPLWIARRIRYPEQLRSNTDIVFFGQVLATHPATCLPVPISRIYTHEQRSRKQLDRIIATGMQPVDALFDPKVIPPALMPLRTLYQARRHRSIARMLYLNGRYDEASRHYGRAFKLMPASMLEFGSLKKALVSMLRRLLGS